MAAVPAGRGQRTGYFVHFSLILILTLILIRFWLYLQEPRLHVQRHSSELVEQFRADVAAELLTSGSAPPPSVQAEPQERREPPPSVQAKPQERREPPPSVQAAPQEGTPAVQEGTLAVQERTPAVQEGTPAVQERTPAVQEDTLPPPIDRQLHAASKVHVCLCSDSDDLRPLAVAINSTIAHAADPSRIVFHIYTTQERAESVFGLLFEYLTLGGAKLRVHYNSKLQAQITEMVTFRKSSGARVGLASPFNFAPFYMDRFVNHDGMVPSRIIYLDTDVVLMGDIAELYDLSMWGQAVSAVEDCSQTFENYINFEELERRGWRTPDLRPEACVFNRGVFVVDVAKWREQKIHDKIELWMGRYSEGEIYHHGMSQPPWLLGLVGNYNKLSGLWNCRGLGRESMSHKEAKRTKRSLGIPKGKWKAIGMRRDGMHWRPYLSACSKDAMLLHFNGPMKPWSRPSWDIMKKPSKCIRTDLKVSAKAQERKDFMQCADLWWRHLRNVPKDELTAVVKRLPAPTTTR